MIISREPQAAAPGAPGYEFHEREAQLWDGELRSRLGDTDLGTSPRRRWAEGMATAWSRQERLVASDGGQVLALATLSLPLLDNTHIGYLSVVVDPARRGVGIGAALLGEVRALASSQGRHVLQAWTWEPLTAPRPGTLAARDGDAVIDPASSPGARFLLGHGFRLAQVDTMSRMELPTQEELEKEALRARESVPADYRLVQWRGDTPGRWADDLAQLQRVMSIDVPTGEAELQPEDFDRERVLAEERLRRLGGLDELVTAVEHEGRLIGYTRVMRDEATPDVGDQWDTLVTAPHRGHGLGWLMKTTSHAALRPTWPGIRRLVTGNASENTWMLAINRRLGYEPFAASGWFELREEGEDGSH